MAFEICCAPPTSTVIAPASARCTPPVTGQASVATPRLAARAASASTSAKSLVLISIQVLPARMAGSASSMTAAVAFGRGQAGDRRRRSPPQAAASRRPSVRRPRARIARRRDPGRGPEVEATARQIRGQVPSEIAESDESVAQVELLDESNCLPRPLSRAADRPFRDAAGRPRKGAPAPPPR